MMKPTTAAILAALALAGSKHSAEAFVPNHSATSAKATTTSLSMAGPGDTATKDIPYGETSRQFRRTVYTHDDWVKHRSPNRFVKNLFSIGSSGIYKNVGREVSTTTTVATIIFLWNMLTVGYDDFNQIHHAPLIDNYYVPGLTLPLTPFTLASGSLGLLLVFRTNTAYQRWDEARKNWGMNM
ncbi:unnamed protein product [Pseudo-nitzschia multistriata]|uniref:PSI-J n=1 Tax=Pseudo-nitzschia multistriata TaxID=183589 RepID=A0A448ZEA7_9STRA|nr:unnamed protein product [Pseudo-nitzschia multistriata]